MTNNERFNQLLNSCKHPRAVYDALAAQVAQEARTVFPEFFAGKSDREVIDKIADAVRRDGEAIE